jgi:hypothetical protein
MAFGFTRTLPTITGSHSDFPVLLTDGSFPTAAVDGGANSIDNGGGNLRAYTDDTKATQLPLEVVTFVTGGAPDVQVWVKIPVAATGNTIYLEADSVATTQPAVTDTYGRNAVWQNQYHHVYHFNDDGVDSVGTGEDIITTGATFNDDSNGTRAININGTSYSVVGSALDSSEPLSMEVRFKPTSYPSGVKFIAAVSNNNAFSQWAGVRIGTPATGSPLEGQTTSGGNQKAVTTSPTLNSWSNAFYRMVSQTSRSIYLNGGDKVTNTNAEQLPVSATLIQIGARSNPSVDLFVGDASTFRIRKDAPSDDFILTLNDVESNPGAWGTSSAWVDGGGGEALVIDSGTYTLSGTAVALKAAFTTAVDSGSYSLSGTATGLRVDSNTVAESGSYTLTGTEAALRAASNVIAENGVYNLTGTDVTLTYTPSAPGETLTIDSGVFSLTGSSVGLIAARKTQIDSGSYSLTGQDVALTTAFNTVADSGAYSLTGSNLPLRADRVIIPQTGTYNLIGTSVILSYSGDIIQTIGTVTAGFVDSGITTDFKADDITTSFKVNSITVNFKG